jgi:glycerophosphoryl diester phosphodiesterase
MVKRILLVILVLLAAGLLVAHLTAKPAPDHPFFNQFSLGQYPLVIAHAGSELYPHDTLFALKEYAAMGVDVLEMDLHMTADGEIILIHDDTVDRTTNGSGDVREMTLGEVQALDAGWYWTKDEQSYPFRGQGIMIPTLREVFESFPDYAMIIEIKQDSPSMAAPLCQMIREYGLENKVMVASSREIAMQEFRSNCAEVATSATRAEVKQFVVRGFMLLGRTITPAYEALHVPEKDNDIPVVTPLFLWFAHNRNLQVHIWTINDAEEIQRFIDMGLDGIMTDRTDIMMEILGR